MLYMAYDTMFPASAGVGAPAAQRLAASTLPPFRSILKVLRALDNCNYKHHIPPMVPADLW